MNLKIVESTDDEICKLLSTCIGHPDEEKLASIIDEYLNTADHQLLVSDDHSGLIGIKSGRNGSCEIRHISVDPNQRFRGIGASLIETIMNTRNCAVLYLETDDDSLEFYRKCNFIIIDEGEKYPGRTRYFCMKSIPEGSVYRIPMNDGAVSILEIHRNRIRDLEQISLIASEEGHLFVHKLLEDYASGKNTFQHHSEILIGLFKNSRCLGVCGLNIDPYAKDVRVGRLRRLYISPAYRQKGYGEMLVSILINRARIHFHMIHLFTTNPDAARLNERLGFRRVDAGRASHRLYFGEME